MIVFLHCLILSVLESALLVPWLVSKPLRAQTDHRSHGLQCKSGSREGCNEISNEKIIMNYEKQ